MDPQVVKEKNDTKNEDGSVTTTYKLQEDLKWSNGDPITAKDYVFRILYFSHPVLVEMARIFHAACDALGVEPGATLHIGDDLELDVLAARRAGLHAAWLLRPELGRPSVVNNTERRGALQPYFFSLLSIDNVVQR